METILIIIVVGTIIFILSRKGNYENNSVKRGFNYTRKFSLMTPSELIFFKKLETVIGDRYYIFPQLHLSAFLDEKVLKQSWKKAFYAINGKSVDFMLVDKESMIPTLAIELDDPTHDRQDRITRDKIVNEIMAQTKMKILHFRDLKIDNEKLYQTIKSKILETYPIVGN